MTVNLTINDGEWMLTMICDGEFRELNGQRRIVMVNFWKIHELANDG